MSYFPSCGQNWLFSVMFFGASVCIFALIISGFSFRQSKSLTVQDDRNTGTPQSLKLSSHIERNCDGNPSDNKQEAGEKQDIVSIRHPFERKCSSNSTTNKPNAGYWKNFNIRVDLVFNQTYQFLSYLNDAENNTPGEKIQIGDKNILFEKLPKSSLNFSRIRGNFEDGLFQVDLRLNSGWEFYVNIEPNRCRLIKVGFIPKNVTISLTKKLIEDSLNPFEDPMYKSFDYDIRIEGEDASDDEPPIDTWKKKFKQRLKTIISEKVSKHTQHELLKFYQKEYQALECSIVKLMPLRAMAAKQKRHIMRNFSEIEVNSVKWKLQEVKISKWPDLRSTEIVYLENGIVGLRLKMTNTTVYVTTNSPEQYNDVEIQIDEVFVTLTRNGNVTKKSEIRFEGFAVINKDQIGNIDEIKNALEKSMESCLDETGNCFKNLQRSP
ncbi:uncharacterized protein LOC135837260 [Planococcus citri]|uniref:uncharacterized protein LOC135837260 n=1 Tax=Planococcus citri TaxID=170843 RepID=UPI0031F89981